MGADGIEKVTVVTDNDDGVVKVGKEVFKPVNRFEVKVVGRFIQQENIGISEQGLGEENTNFHVVLNVTHFLLLQISGDSQSIEHLGGLGLSLPSSHFSEFTFKFSRPQAILLGEVLFRIDGVPFLHHGIQLLIAHNDCFKNRIIVEGKMVLSEYSHPLAG
ncbi:hypothetical protein DSECCO2_602550 [anaerobic digester metagenome]